MPAKRQGYSRGQIMAGSSFFGALAGVMIVQTLIPGGDESMGMTLGGVGIGFVIGLLGAFFATRSN